MHADDRFMWVSDMGWIMGPKVVVGAGALGATLVLSEGAPDHPGPERLWQQVERHRITVLGVSPTLIRALKTHGDAPVLAHDRSSLRILASTGEAWNPEPYRWLHNVVGEGRRPIINLSGGTEVGACFLSPMPVMPLKECTLGAPSLGMAMDVVDADGNHLPAGEVGELVCRRPWPSMTRGVWRDPQRYLRGVLVAAARDLGARRLGVGRRGRLLVPARPLGRHAQHRRQADRAGRVRVGRGRPPGGGRGLRRSACPTRSRARSPGCTAWPPRTPSQPPSSRPRSAPTSPTILGKAFAPARVEFVPALPKTRSAKIVRRAVRAAALGLEQGDLSCARESGLARGDHGTRRSRRWYPRSVMSEGLLHGKTALVAGVANKRSIAWAIAQKLHEQGATLAFTYQGERLEGSVRKLAESIGSDLVVDCDVSDDATIERAMELVGDGFSGGLDILVHSIAYAPPDAFQNRFIETSRGRRLRPPWTSRRTR